MFNLESLQDPPKLARSKELEPLLEGRVFLGLTEIQPWFDSPAVRHFNAPDFRIVVERCTLLGIMINGVEVFTPSGELLEVRTAEDDLPSDSWCLNLIEQYRADTRLSFAASYSA